MTRRMFSILNDLVIRSIPWDAISPHEEQAMKNHSQTLERLHSRGGLSIHEAYHIMKGQPFPSGFKRSSTNDAAYRVALMRILHDHEKAKEDTQ